MKARTKTAKRVARNVVGQPKPVKVIKSKKYKLRGKLNVDEFKEEFYVK